MFRLLRNLICGDSDSSEHRQFIQGVCNGITTSLDPLIPRGASCALVDFPNYPNVGDSAIWLGEQAYLKTRQVKVVFGCDTENYQREQMANAITEETIILLQGGGNLGDLWPWHQKLREKVIADFPNNRIIVFPQSIHFRNAVSLQQAKEVFETHKALTLMVREKQSLEIAREHFKVTTVHCPDMAFFLGALTAKSKPIAAVSCLLRTDAEARELEIPTSNENVLADDWVIDDANLKTQSVDSNSGNVHEQKLQLYDLFATQRLERGCKMLGQGRTVVTDRLHGHILSILMGIPHIVLDNSYGKIRAVYDTWTKDCGLVEWAESRKQAVEQSLRLAANPAKGRR